LSGLRAEVEIVLQEQFGPELFLLQAELFPFDTEVFPSQAEQLLFDSKLFMFEPELFPQQAERSLFDAKMFPQQTECPLFDTEFSSAQEEEIADGLQPEELATSRRPLHLPFPSSG
jgi:hypothetical protein